MNTTDAAGRGLAGMAWHVPVWLGKASRGPARHGGWS